MSNALNEMIDGISTTPVPDDVATAFSEAAEILVKSFAPMMPHLAEECWARLGNTRPVSEEPWPRLDIAYTTTKYMTLAVQVNGKRRAEITINRDADSKAIENAVFALQSVQNAIDGKPVRKVIIVPTRIVNVVV